MPMHLAPLSTIGPARVEALLDAAFGADRHRRTAYRIRAGTVAVAPLSFAACEGTRLVGSLQSWPVTLETKDPPRPSSVPMILVGPVAVAPDCQRRGIGRRLMQALIDAQPRDPLVMIGDPDYYGRFFGFSADATQHWQVPGPVERHRLLARFAGVLPGTGSLGPRTFALAETNA
jgi:predicted N-acetyltransferase YhbS